MRNRLAILGLVTAAGAAAEPALAVPAFARRYRVACHVCHEGYPKLSPVGERFKERGFRMEKEESFDLSGWARSVPLSVRPSARQSFLEEGPARGSAVFKAVSAGNLGRRISYWLDDALLLDEESPGPRHGEPDNFWVRAEVIPGGRLYARAGRMELDLPFTQARTPHLLGYDIYSANPGFESDTIAGHQDGIEVGGELPRGARWSAALVKGRNAPGADAISEDASGFDGNLFLRFSERVGKQRLGGFAHVGRNTLALAPGLVWDDDYFRLGLDVNLWIRRLNLYGLFSYGRWGNPVATPAQPAGTREAVKVTGGFLQGDYHLRDEVVLTLRLDVVGRPPGRTSLPRETFVGLSPGVQVWILDRLKLSFEYGFENRGRLDVGALQAEIAF